MTALTKCGTIRLVINAAKEHPERWPFVSGQGGDTYFNLQTTDTQTALGPLIIPDITVVTGQNPKSGDDKISLLVRPPDKSYTSLDVMTFNTPYDLSNEYLESLDDTYSLFESPVFGPHPTTPPNKNGKFKDSDLNSWKHQLATVGYVLENVVSSDLSAFIRGYTDTDSPYSNNINVILLQDFTARNIKANGHLNVALTLSSEFMKHFKNDVALKDAYIEDYITASMSDYTITTLRTEGLRNLNTGEKVNYFSHGNVWKIVTDPTTETETVTSNMAIRSDNATSQITALSYLNGVENYTILSSGNMAGNLFLSGVTRSRNTNNQYSLISGDYPSSEHSSVQYHADRNCFSLWASVEGANQRVNLLNLQNDTLNSAGTRKSHTLSILAAATDPYLPNNLAIRVTNEAGTRNYLQTTSNYDTYEDEHEYIRNKKDIPAELPTPLKTIIREEHDEKNQHFVQRMCLLFSDGYEIELWRRTYAYNSEPVLTNVTNITPFDKTEIKEFYESPIGLQRRRNKRIDEIWNSIKDSDKNDDMQYIKYIKDDYLLSWDLKSNLKNLHAMRVFADDHRFRNQDANRDEMEKYIDNYLKEWLWQ